MALPEAPDAAIIAVPAQHVADTLRQLGACGKAAIVFSSDFAELGAEEGSRSG